MKLFDWDNRLSFCYATWCVVYCQVCTDNMGCFLGTGIFLSCLLLSSRHPLKGVSAVIKWHTQLCCLGSPRLALAAPACSDQGEGTRHTTAHEVLCWTDPFCENFDSQKTSKQAQNRARNKSKKQATNLAFFIVLIEINLSIFYRWQDRPADSPFCN